MGSRSDEAKGRVKEAVGDLTDNRKLEREGKLDQAGAKAKQKAEKAKNKADEMIDSMKERLDKD